MLNLIVKLHNVLNLIKGFTVGYSSSSSDKMVIEHEGKYYLLQLTEVKPYVTDQLKERYNVSEEKLQTDIVLQDTIKMHAILEQYLCGH